MGKLQDKIVIITGGNSGIGLASAKLFAEEGASVVITGRRADVVDAAIAEIGHDAVGLVADVTSPADHQRLVEEVRERFGRIDVYFANAGIGELAPLGATTEDLYDRIFDINVKGLYFGVQAALPLIADGGSIILTGSVAGVKAIEGFGVYSATKAAIRSFVRTWTVELKDRNIRANVLSPGPVKTPIVGKMGLSDADLQAFEEGIVGTVPMGRWGEPEELAKAALFLASSDSSFVTGVELYVDGGLAQV
jgi:NAD(P)-dependent dehydrogenase (short-subunit alcohol dehydrogenase family)